MDPAIDGTSPEDRPPTITGERVWAGTQLGWVARVRAREGGAWIGASRVSSEVRNCKLHPGRGFRSLLHD